MQFLDEAVVEFASGKGGDGSVSFHREKHVPRGGPNGADGGRGGNIVLIADRGKRTLYDFKLQPRFAAENGLPAVTNKRGRDGHDTEVRLPVGTIVYDAETNEPIVDLHADGARYVLCRGGRGGHGNLHFVSSVRQAPRLAEKGEPGESIRARLELKLLADIGLIGMPNAGKSTLIGRISASKAKVADYPFTTLVPNLGVVDFAETTFTVADMPGLIEGASAGHGLGHQFLRHAERTAALVHVVDVFPIDGSDPWQNFQTIEEELRAYSEDLWRKPRLIALNKIDLIDEDHLLLLKETFEETGHPLYAISGVVGQGIDELLYAMVELLKEAPPAEERVIVVTARSQEEDAFTVEPIADGFEIRGRKVERIVAMTNMSSEDSVRYLHRRLMRMGVIEKLRELGAEDGDTVVVGKFEFAYTDEA